MTWETFLIELGVVAIIRERKRLRLAPAEPKIPFHSEQTAVKILDTQIAGKCDVMVGLHPKRLRGGFN